MVREFHGNVVVVIVVVDVVVVRAIDFDEQRCVHLVEHFDPLLCSPDVFGVFPRAPGAGPNRGARVSGPGIAFTVYAFVMHEPAANL